MIRFEMSVPRRPPEQQARSWWKGWFRRSRPVTVSEILDPPPGLLALKGDRIFGYRARIATVAESAALMNVQEQICTTLEQCRNSRLFGGRSSLNITLDYRGMAHTVSEEQWWMYRPPFTAALRAAGQLGFRSVPVPDELQYDVRFCSVLSYCYGVGTHDNCDIRLECHAFVGHAEYCLHADSPQELARMLPIFMLEMVTNIGLHWAERGNPPRIVTGRVGIPGVDTRPAVQAVLNTLDNSAQAEEDRVSAIPQVVAGRIGMGVAAGDSAEERRAAA